MPSTRKCWSTRPSTRSGRRGPRGHAGREHDALPSDPAKNDAELRLERAAVAAGHAHATHLVILRFEPRGTQIRVTLFHAGWGSLDGADGKEREATYQYFDKAWTPVLANLQKRYAPGGKPMDWTEWHERMTRAGTTK